MCGLGTKECRNVGMKNVGTRNAGMRNEGMSRVTPLLTLEGGT